MRNALQLSGEIEHKKSVNQVVTINVPKTWDFTQCGRNRKTSYRKSLSAADIEIRGEQQNSGSNRPWTLQHLGCGKRGLAVSIPEGFFTPTEDVLEHHRKGNK